MQEDFLHYIWQYKKFNTLQLATTQNESLIIESVGTHNHNTGPDFFNAKLIIAKQLWAGNVEIHVNASDWYVHNHENDANYDNVILHVVWEHDTDIYRKDQTVIPTLELKQYISKEALLSFDKLFAKKQSWINCENDFALVNDFTIQNWLERLYFERLERKANNIELLLKPCNNSWEEVLFKMLAKNFGLKVNGEAFLSIANSFEFSVLRKQQSKQQSLEALLFGQAGLLETDVQEVYVQELQRVYKFLKTKFQLTNASVLPVQFFRLRPSNFPTIRLSQLASLYHSHSNVFSKIIEAKTVEELYVIFNVKTSSFWETHYTFSKVSKRSVKRLTKSFVNLLIINTIAPLKFSYAKYQGKNNDDLVMGIIQQLPPEKNSIVNKYNTLKEVSQSALQSQALLQLKNEYCNKNKCLQCAIGSTLIR
ncbi:DUF2851 family protein [Pontimicrobium aquaticum]|uniref:DUF2851 family protein n=1 Tax=Pontimicrobium aquaticum TaxID=2565367 RepID=A0A4U0EWZ0_9FLAO|nr:DUF2851 family protein [Pontimicrobium aquaticum]TJY36380.1 DUF2851 family protein [Pontimicrobium aquaticum]